MQVLAQVHMGAQNNLLNNQWTLIGLFWTIIKTKTKIKKIETFFICMIGHPFLTIFKVFVWLFTDCSRTVHELFNDCSPDWPQQTWPHLNNWWTIVEISVNNQWLFIDCSVNNQQIYVCSLNVQWYFNDCSRTVREQFANSSWTIINSY